MLKLPFKIQPKEPETIIVGDENIGTIEIPKIGDLSPNERIAIREHMKAIPDLRTEAVRLAKGIAEKSGLRIIDTYNALVAEDISALENHLEELLKFQATMENYNRERATILTTVVLRRIVPGWGVEDSGELHPQLFAKILEFAQNEENGWEKPEVAELSEEDLGKDQKNQTGEKSSGAATDIGLATTVLVATTSETSQLG